MRRDERAVTEVLGYIFVFSLVVSTVAFVGVTGMDTLQTTRDAEQVDNAERAFDLLATNMDDLATRGAPSRSTEIKLSDASLAISTPVEFTFRGIDTSDPSNNFSESYDVRPIEYTTPDRASTIAYVAGAVLRTERQGGTAIRRPPIVASDGRLVLPLLQTRSRAVQTFTGGTVRVRATKSATDILVSDTHDTYDTVFVNVTSVRAPVWNRTLDEYEAFDCRLNTSAPVDRAVCEASDPRRVHVSQVRVDTVLER